MAIDTSIRIRLIDGFSAGLRSLQSGVGSLSSSFAGLSRASQFAGNLNQAAEGMERFGSMARSAIEVPTQAFIGFETAMSRVSALSREVGTTAFGQMQAQAQELGAATSFSASEAATAMGNFATAGMSANQILALTPPTMALARAAATGLDQTSEILGNTLNALGINASQAGMAADVLTSTFTSSNTTLTSLGESFKVAAPLALQTGASIQTLASMIAVLGNSGIQGSEAGTGLRTAMASLAEPAGAGAEALARLGFQGERLVHLQRLLATGSLPEALAEVGNSMNDLTADRRLAALMNIFGREGVTSGAILINAAMDTSDRGLAGYARALRDVDGTASRTAAIMEDNLGGEMERLSGAVDGLYISLGERFAPGLRQLAVDMQGTVEGVSQWAGANPALLSSLGTALTYTVGLAAGVRAMALVASAATTTTASLKVGLAGLVSPAGLVVAAFGSIALAAYQIAEAERRLQEAQAARQRAHMAGEMELRQQQEQIQRTRLRTSMDRRTTELLGQPQTEETAAELAAIAARTAMLDREEQVSEARNTDDRRLLEINQSGQENTAAGRRERAEIEARRTRRRAFVAGTAGYATDEEAAASGAFGLDRLGQSGTSSAAVFGARRSALSQGSDVNAGTPLGASGGVQDSQVNALAQAITAAVLRGEGGGSAGVPEATAANTAATARLTTAIDAMTRALRNSGGGGPTPLGGSA